MRKFGLEASQFPKDTEFVNHRENFFVRNREALIPALILITALNVIICWVCFDNYRRRKLLLEEVFNICSRRTTPNSLFVVHGICYSKAMKNLWKQLQNDERVGITFDLYDVGLLFFDTTKIKQHYGFF